MNEAGRSSKIVSIFDILLAFLVFCEFFLFLGLYFEINISDCWSRRTILGTKWSQNGINMLNIQKHRCNFQRYSISVKVHLCQRYTYPQIDEIMCMMLKTQMNHQIHLQIPLQHNLQVPPNFQQLHRQSSHKFFLTTTSSLSSWNSSPSSKLVAIKLVFALLIRAFEIGITRLKFFPSFSLATLSIETRTSSLKHLKIKLNKFPMEDHHIVIYNQSYLWFQTLRKRLLMHIAGRKNMFRAWLRREKLIRC